jgi:hypothetical protein
MKKSILFLAVVFFLSSCSVQAPKEQEVKQTVAEWYAQQQQDPNAGIWDIKGITVLTIKPDSASSKVFNTKSVVTGTFRSAPSSTPVPDKPFEDTIRMNLEWNGAKWISAKE